MSILRYDVLAKAAEAVSTPVVNGIPHGVWLMGAPMLWSQGITGKGVRIAVIDSGIDSDHPALKDKVVARKDYVRDGKPMRQWNPHGTHVAGTIAANSAMLRGVAPDANLVDFRVLGTDGSGSVSNITAAIREAMVLGCQIINMSLGSPFYDADLHRAVQEAVDQGVLVVCAVGSICPPCSEKFHLRLTLLGNEQENAEHDVIGYPGYFPEVVGAGAVEWDPRSGKVAHAFFSNKNHEVDCCADGVEVWSSANGRLQAFSGTSMASPHVSGSY